MEYLFERGVNSKFQCCVMLWQNKIIDCKGNDCPITMYVYILGHHWLQQYDDERAMY